LFPAKQSKNSPGDRIEYYS